MLHWVERAVPPDLQTKYKNLNILARIGLMKVYCSIYAPRRSQGESGFKLRFLGKNITYFK